MEFQKRIYNAIKIASVSIAAILVACGTEKAPKKTTEAATPTESQNSEEIPKKTMGSFDSNEIVLAKDALAESVTEWFQGLNIVGGTATDSTTSKSVIGIISEESICSGTLITSNLVVSARHCFADTNPANYFLGFGSDLKTASIRRTTKITILPKTVVSGIALDDIALVEFEGGLPNGYEVLPVVSPSTSLADFDTILIAGYGLVNSSDPNAKGDLKQATNRIIAIDDNLKLFQTLGVNGTACFGDSGGAVMGLKNNIRTLIGVISQSPSTDCSGVLYSLDLRKYSQFLSSNGYVSTTPEVNTFPGSPVAASPGAITSQTDPVKTQDPLQADSSSSEFAKNFEASLACHEKADLFFQYGIVKVYRASMQDSSDVWKNLVNSYVSKMSLCATTP